MDLSLHRRFFAEDLWITSNLASPALVEALATVPRERFLPPGPWIVRGQADLMGPLRTTPGDDPRFVYHDLSIAIDRERMLFNGSPGFVARVIDALGLRAGERVLHVGAGTGYFTAVMAQVVGAAGRVDAVEVDERLASEAAAHLAGWPWAHPRQGDGVSDLDGPYDAILVNAGVTHPERAWLDALAPGGRLALPLTTSGMAGPALPKVPGVSMDTISKGLMLLVTRTDDAARFQTRVLTFVAIYSAIGLRDDASNTELARALARSPFPPIRTLRLDPHEPTDTCWLHTGRGCWSTAA